ncbi:MAG: hypothetical protein Kow00122_19590 [Thermoleophilia bacterium]
MRMYDPVQEPADNSSWWRPHAHMQPQTSAPDHPALEKTRAIAYHPLHYTPTRIYGASRARLLATGDYPAGSGRG